MMIDIDHVSFQYSGAEQENLQDFNLQIKKGECVVLTGESGCGKTCVTRLINTLIPHFYEGELSGAVLIDGVDTRTIQPHDLSDKIGSVFQNPRSQFFSLDTDTLTPDECDTLKRYAVNGIIANADNKRLKEKLASAEKTVSIWKQRYEAVSEKYMELKQKAQPFLDALEIASERVRAFINSILIRGKETQEHKHPAQKRGQDMEL